MDHHHDLIMTGQSHCRGRLPIEDTFVERTLHFQVVIAGSQGAELVDAAFNRIVRDVRRVGAVEAAAFLDAIQILFPPVALWRCTTLRLCA